MPEQIRMCNVIGCLYEGTTDYYGFWLCLLHDHDNTKAILHRGELPGSYWMHGYPIIVPTGKLEESHFEPKWGGKRVDPRTDPRLLNLPEKPSGHIHEAYRLI